MDLSVVIVNWKVRDLLEKCLESLYRFTDGLEFEVFVVDNDSQDGSVEMVASRFPQAELIASNRNLGFAKGNNEAIRQSRGEFVLLLNPDTEFIDNALVPLVEFMRRTPAAGICGSKLLNSDQSLQPSVRRFPHLSDQLLIMLKLHHLLPQARCLRRYLARDFHYEEAQACDQVMGAVFLIRRELLDRIGLLDERYYIWFEEVDYCRLARDAGFEVWYTPEAAIIHHGGESFGQVFGPRKQQIFNRSLRQYFRKHHGLGAWLVLLLIHPLSMALAWLSAGRGKKK